MIYKHLLLPLLMGTLWLSTSAQPNTSRFAQNTRLSFVENKGQVQDQHRNARPEIDFKLQAALGLNLFIGSGQLHYQFVQPLQLRSVEDLTDRSLHTVQENSTAGILPEAQERSPQQYALYRLDVTLIGANTDAKIIQEDRVPYYERYFMPWINTADAHQGVLAGAYQKITYQDVYPNIDWVFYFNAQGQLEHDFVVHPDGKIGDIKMRYSGSTELHLQEDGGLQASTPLGEIRENAPYAYTRDGQPVGSAFVLEGDLLSFKTDDYSGTLIIDPVIEWGTYFGGPFDEMTAAGDLATDNRGNAYLAGVTNSLDNIATSGAFQDTLTGLNDAFLSKWSTDGDLLWATYYGGQQHESNLAVSCDTSGNIYLGGGTMSLEGIATPGSYQPHGAGNLQHGSDAFLVKFDSAGNRLWGTYIGGTGQDASTTFDLDIDPWNHIYLTGDTRSADFPVTAGTHQTTKGGNANDQDLFIARFDTDGQLQWGTFFGGERTESYAAIAADDSGHVYLTGHTQSQDGVATAGAFQSVHAGAEDAFLTKFDSTGRQLWGTYFGGDGIDLGHALALNDAYVGIAGVTTSTGMASANAHQTALADASGDGLIALFNLSGQSLWASYYGGANADGINGITINASNEIYISGQTQSDTGIATPGSHIPDFVGIYDAFIAKFDSTGIRQWGTYMGGTSIELHGLLAADQNKNLYLAGTTMSANGIAMNQAYQSSLSGGFDGFLIKLNDCEVPVAADSIDGSMTVCKGSTEVYQVTDDPIVGEYLWILPTDWVGQSDSHQIEVVVGDSSGLIRLVGKSACGGISDTQSLAVSVLPAPEPEIQKNDDMLSATQTYASYQWMVNGLDIQGATDAIHLAEIDGYYQLRVRNADSCLGVSDSVLVEGTAGVQAYHPTVDVQLYPNPSSGQLFLEATTGGFIQGFNLEGKQVLALRPFTKGLNRFDFKHLSVGIYLMKMVTEDGVKIVKWIKE